MGYLRKRETPKKVPVLYYICGLFENRMRKIVKKCRQRKNNVIYSGRTYKIWKRGKG